MRISTYTTLCPECRVAGVDRYLGFDTDYGISCEANPPHQYENMPGEAEAQTAPERHKTDEETHQPDAVPEVPAEVAHERFTEVLKARESAESSASTEDPPMLEAKPLDVATLEAIKIQPGAVLPTEAGVVVGEGEVVTLPNGDVLVGVRIKETWVQAIQAEAENQNQSFTQYLQDYLNEVALQGQWVAAPAPK